MLNMCMAAPRLTTNMRKWHNSAWISDQLHTSQKRYGIALVFTTALIGVSLDLQAVLVDMEEGVVNQVLQGALREVFDTAQLLTDVSGSGNNW